MKKNFFYKKSKADTIETLKKTRLQFKIPKTLSFTTRDWKFKKKEIVKKIKIFFKKNKKIAVRSSSRSEDKAENSQAGKFLSLLNLPSQKDKKIIEAINSVIKSYKSKNLKDQIFVQEMISNVSVSGVIFTKDVDTGLNYYVINYDDISGKTDTVTSGTGVYSNRILFIFKKFGNKIKSPRFKKLISCVYELEKKIDNNNLDIEFAVTKKLEPYLLQVRPISTIKNWKKVSIKTHEKYLIKVEKKLKNNFQKKKKILGKKTIFGLMPDWNPVEMIGKYPSELSFSLYKRLITDSIWAKSRAIMGYKDLSKHKLMNKLSGQPYIDTRLSLNSFLPKTLSNKIGEKLVNFGIEELSKNPQFHDKVEFEISFPSYTFDIKDRIKKKLGSYLSKSETKVFIDKIRLLTLEMINEKSHFSYKNILKKISYLDKNFKNFNNKDINQIPQLILMCKNYGTLNFSILARHGFVAKSLLNSIIDKKVISKEKGEKFEKSLNTITKKMLIDIDQVSKKKLSIRNFMKNYGHLRPGTYDITSTRYDQTKNFFFKVDKKKIKINNFKLTKNEKIKLNNTLISNKFEGIDHKILIDYISNSISLREYSKFIFTKYLSLILEIIANFGRIHNISRHDLANLNINCFEKSKKNISLERLKRLLIKNKLIYQRNQIIKLPVLIQDISRTRIIPYQINLPNFITRKKVEGQILHNPDFRKSNKLKNKIIFIDNADPGYDWLFGFEILGLVTKYGGINSHMSIRCSELGIPAAIGCGEQIFSELLKKNSISLDCSSSAIYSM